MLLISATPLGWAAEPGGATIVLQLQLPPSTSPEAVKGLIADLAAKGALPVTQPTEPAGMATQATITAENLAAHFWDPGTSGSSAGTTDLDREGRSGRRRTRGGVRVLDGGVCGSHGRRADRNGLPRAGRSTDT